MIGELKSFRERLTRVRMSQKKTDKSDCFQERLTTKSRRAFAKLCKKGCDKDYLTFLFTRLCNTDPIELSFEQADGRIKKTMIPHLDTLTRKQMFGGFTSRKFQQIAKRAKELEEDIRELKQTEFVQALWRENRIPPRDLLAISALEFTPSPFMGLLNLPELAKKYHPSRKPAYTGTLIKVIKHVAQHTGDWHDTEIADILYDLFCVPGETDPPYNQNQMRRWRELHGLKTIKVKTRKGKLIHSLPR